MDAGMLAPLLACLCSCATPLGTPYLRSDSHIVVCILASCKTDQREIDQQQLVKPQPAPVGF